ncbi:hypothetical protein ABPG72_018551 [Tetrahymena utriculariae]
MNQAQIILNIQQIKNFLQNYNYQFQKYLVQHDSYIFVQAFSHQYRTNVAIKIFRDIQLEFQLEKEILEKMKGEKYILQVISNILDQNMKINAIVTELFDCDLKCIMSSNKLTFEQVVVIMFQLLKALVVLQEKEVVHSDISPDNILFCSSKNEIILSDFSKESNVKNISLLQNSKKRVKISFYMSPEVVNGEQPLTNKVDMFSIGIIILQLLLNDTIKPMEILSLKCKLLEDAIPSIKNHQNYEFIQEFLSSMVNYNSEQRQDPLKLILKLERFQIDKTILKTLILPQKQNVSSIQAIQNPNLLQQNYHSNQQMTQFSQSIQPNFQQQIYFNHPQHIQYAVQSQSINQAQLTTFLQHINLPCQNNQTTQQIPPISYGKYPPINQQNVSLQQNGLLQSLRGQALLFQETEISKMDQKYYDYLKCQINQRKTELNIYDMAFTNEQVEQISNILSQFSLLEIIKIQVRKCHITDDQGLMLFSFLKKEQNQRLKEIFISLKENLMLSSQSLFPLFDLLKNQQNILRLFLFLNNMGLNKDSVIIISQSISPLKYLQDFYLDFSQNSCDYESFQQLIENITINNTQIRELSFTFEYMKEVMFEEYQKIDKTLQKIDMFALSGKFKYMLLNIAGSYQNRNYFQLWAQYVQRCQRYWCFQFLY